MVQLQDSILKCFHYNAFSNMLFDTISETHRAWILSCFSPKAISLQLYESFQPFDYLPQFFPHQFICDLNYLIPQLLISFDVCAHIPLILWVSTSYVALIATNALKPMMWFVTFLSPLHEMLIFTWDEKNYMHFFQLDSTPFINGSILCSPKMAFAP
jgi:hypothetical protein